MCRWGDGFQHKELLNDPIDTIDMIDRIEKLTRFEWLKNQKAEWKMTNPELKVVLTQHGKCFNINGMEKVYNNDRLEIFARIQRTFLIKKLILVSQLIFDQIGQSNYKKEATRNCI